MRGQASLHRALFVLAATAAATLLPAAGAGPAAGAAPPEWWDQVQARIRHAEYEVTWQTSTVLPDLADAWHAPNRAHDFRTYFTEQGIRVVARSEATPSWEWRLALTAYGREGQERHTVGPARLSARANRIDCARDTISEWYVNYERGLEQGFTLLAPPEAATPAGPIFLELALGGGLAPLVHADRQGIDFTTAAGSAVLRYAELRVTDARGEVLPSWMDAFAQDSRRGLRLWIDDREALYPLAVDPLASSPIWHAEVNQTSASFASSVATAGDVNADSYADIIVGAPNYDNGQNDEGHVFVYYGAPGGPPTTPSWEAENNIGGSWFGWSVATAGDINSDGYSEVIVGAPLQSGSEAHEGRVFVYYGSASGLPAAISWTMDSDQISAELGWSVASAGDVNHDGYSDILLGAPYFDNGQTDEGRVFLHRGSAFGLEDTPAWTAEGNQTGAGFGWSVSGAGDVNGDLYGDIVIGSVFYDNGETDEGRIYAFYGSASGPVTGFTTTEVDKPSAWLGWSVGPAGDVNGDGYADVIAGARQYGNGQNNEGAAFLFSGSSGGMATSPSWTVEGNQIGAGMGWSVGTAGDVDGDGYADVVVGAALADNGAVIDAGRVLFFAGSPAGLSTTPSLTINGDQDFAAFGSAVATAGDVDGDGYSDVIVGAPHYDNVESDEGRAFLYRGSPGSPATLAAWTAETNQTGARSGASAGTAGDVNGDGFSDLIVGAPLYDNGQTDEGQAYLFLGSPSGPETSPSWTVESDQAGAHLGASVAAAGDINDDGYGDVIVGAPDMSAGQSGEGLAFLYTGSASGLAPSASWTGEGNQAGAQFGFSVASAGDIDGDGLADVIVGAPQYSNGESGEGRALAYRGTGSGLSTTATWAAEGGQAGAAFGRSVAAAGDVDRDGHAEVIVGAPLYDGPVSDGGRAYVYRGTVFGLITQPEWTASGGQAAEHLGWSVAGAGDVNGDGFGDVIVGAPQYSNGQSNEGAAFAYLGSNGGPAGAAVWVTEGEQVGANLGWSVAGAGDVNGDGYTDVIVGAPQYSNGQSGEGLAAAYLGSAAGLSGTAAWRVESNQAGASLGSSVASAGDPNADGRADLVVGAPALDNGETDEGRSILYYGGGGGLSLVPRQLQATDGSPIGAQGRSDSEDQFRIAARARTPYGTGEIMLQYEVKPVGIAFNGVPWSSTPAWLPVAPTFDFNDAVFGFVPGQLAHWRVRAIYRHSFTPWQQLSRWFTVPQNGWGETDLRFAAQVDVGTNQSDSKDPVFAGEPYTYNLVATSAGPATMDTTLQDTLPPGVSVVSAVPTQGACIVADGVVTCPLGPLLPSGTAQVAVTVQASIAGLQTNVVKAATPATETQPADNTKSEGTAIVVPAIGNRVWLDSDGDGVQDGGEPGMPNVLIALYDDSSNLVKVAVSDATGGYTLPALVYNIAYFVRFFPPPGFVLTLRDQGGNDLLDSDADPFSLETPLFNLTEQADLGRWDVGLIPYCVPPDEGVYIGSMSLTDDENAYPVLNFLDPNQPSQITGYNVYRSSDPVPPPSTWPLLATDVIDMDEATPNKQWIDTTGDVSPSGLWFYQITAYNDRCPAEGPF